MWERIATARVAIAAVLALFFGRTASGTHFPIFSYLRGRIREIPVAVVTVFALMTTALALCAPRAIRRSALRALMLAPAIVALYGWSAAAQSTTSYTYQFTVTWQSPVTNPALLGTGAILNITVTNGQNTNQNQTYTLAQILQVQVTTIGGTYGYIYNSFQSTGNLSELDDYVQTSADGSSATFYFNQLPYGIGTAQEIVSRPAGNLAVDLFIGSYYGAGPIVLQGDGVCAGNLSCAFAYFPATLGNQDNAAAASITGNLVPPAPVAANETATTYANTSVSIDLTAGASGNPTSAALVGTPVGGTVSGFPSTTVTFTPTTGFTGSGSFQFTLSNAGGASNTATTTITVIPMCSPVSLIYSNDTGAAGLLQTVISHKQQIAGGQVTAEVEVKNYLRVWLSLRAVRSSSINNLPPYPSLISDLGAGTEGVAAQAGFLPPCDTNLPSAPCQEPGVSAWTAGFCRQGNITMSFSFDASSAIATFVDLIVPILPHSVVPSLSTIIALSTALEAVPDLKQAAICLGNFNLQCAIAAVLNLIGDPQQLRQVQHIFELSRINLVTNLLAEKLPTGVLQSAADLVVLEIQTGSTNVLTLDVIGQ
jgi:hypothetical protein